jgi:YkoY family integral membrane protein
MNFPPQIFEYGDIAVIGMLILLEGLLSADNALVLALMVRHLPKDQQARALTYGLGGAFIFRAIAILLATLIMKLWWLQAIGAGYLIYMTAKHFWSNKDHHEEKEAGHRADKAGFWKTVFLVEITDIAFAVDSVLAGVALAKASTKQLFESKLWVVYTGAVIGIVLLRYAAKYFLKLLDKFPALEHLAYALVGWAGIKLLVMAGHHFTIEVKPGFTIPEMEPPVFWTVLVLILIAGTWHAVRNANPNADDIPDSIEEDLAAQDSSTDSKE